MRWPPVVLGIAIAGVYYLARTLTIGLDFAYYPQALGGVTLTACVAMIAAFGLAPRLPRRAVVIALAGLSALTIVAIIVYVRYDATHAVPSIDEGWGEREMVAQVPFHVQLAVPVFAALGSAIVSFALAAWRGPMAPAPPRLPRSLRA